MSDRRYLPFAAIIAIIVNAVALSVLVLEFTLAKAPNPPMTKVMMADVAPFEAIEQPPDEIHRQAKLEQQGTEQAAPRQAEVKARQPVELERLRAKEEAKRPVEEQSPITQPPSEVAIRTPEPAAPPPTVESLGAPKDANAAGTVGEVSPRVFVHYTDNQPGAEEAAAQVAAGLAAHGYEVIDIRAFPGRIVRPSTRYFFAADRAETEALNPLVEQLLQAQGMGQASQIMALTNHMPPPRRGTIEVWVPVPKAVTGQR